MIASAPGKLILTGEYAVLDGAPALVIAVDRRAVARRNVGPRGSSEFLLAIVEELIARKGKDHPAARAATEIIVDSTAFYHQAASVRSGPRARRSTGSSPAIDISVGVPGAQKLGIGSSAAVTVAATALALAADCETVPVIDREEVLAIASAAHAAAQGPRGARGSGADIASAVFGGVIAYQRETPDRVAWPIDASARGPSTLAGGTAHRLSWPAGVTIIPFFTGTSADTPTLVAAVHAARERDPVAVEAALKAIDQASRAACQACAMRVPEIAGNALIAAMSLAANATDRLATSTGVALVPGCVTAARAAMARLRGTAKTTGAGGGDIGVAVLPSTEDVTEAKRLLIEAGCQPLALTVDRTGVDLQPDAQ